MLQRRAFEHTAAVRVGGGERILVAAADGFGGFPVSAQRFRAGKRSTAPRGSPRFSGVA